MNSYSLFFCAYSNTIRTKPQNYWVCSVNEDGTLDWSDHDSMTSWMDREDVQKRWESGNVPTDTLSPHNNRSEITINEMAENAKRNPASRWE